ncbi:Hypothetical protein NTJ_12291 [Nesidiocoris tenuis]|uniref:Uncharacterized protein n=1 Tax=Nesidiocoris tenuis TaxID=355587 RepID=A0ABN7B9I8_9HEMI|nr:Hypothetical protein NTJ_12291 [Nesidiocoris tenuis]
MSRCQSSLLDGFTDDWDAALLSEGTLRPKRAASAMNLREAMKTFTKPPLGEVTREDLENNFSRSMKLLGFDRAESASSNKSRPKPKTSNVSPRTITRLHKPTLSYEDIRNAVTGGVDRKILSQAAYERWYFRKLEEEKDSRKMKEFYNLEKDRSKLFERGLMFNEWLQKKDQQRKMKESEPKPTDAKTKIAQKRLPMSSPATKEAAEKAYKDWLNRKEAEQQKMKKKLQEEKEAKNRAKSREDSEKAFEEWKRSCDEKLKKLDQRRRNKAKKLQEKEQDEKERHLQDCEKAFNAWLASKNQAILKQQENEKKRSVKKNAKELEKLAEKRYEAKQAFEDWLEKKLEQEAAKTPPPPTPENKVTKSVQTESKPATPIPKNRPNQATNFPKNLMVPWPEFSAKNRLTSPRNQTAKTKKQKVKFADASWDVPKNLSKSYDYKDLSGIRSLSDAKTIMMLYHKQDPNSALYYARDIS